MKRKVDLVVISDVHLGTYGSRAAELVSYLKSIDPETLVLFSGGAHGSTQIGSFYADKRHESILHHR